MKTEIKIERLLKKIEDMNEEVLLLEQSLVEYVDPSKEYMEGKEKGFAIAEEMASIFNRGALND